MENDDTDLTADSSKTNEKYEYMIISDKEKHKL